MLFLHGVKTLDLIFLMNHFKLLTAMTWNAEKIKTLRCRLGFTQSELARKLHCESDLINTWESAQKNELQGIALHMDTLILLEKQAESAADQIFHSPLAETILEETHESQVHVEAVRLRFFEKN